MTHFSDERGGELRDLFFETAQEILQSLNDDALKLEKSPQDREIIRSLRRSVHTLKGDAAAAGFAELSELAHMLEDALAVEATPEGVSLAEIGFAAADTFGAMLASYQSGTALPEAGALKGLVQRLASNTRSDTGPGAIKAQGRISAAVRWTEYEKLAAVSARSEGKKVFQVAARIDPLCSMPVAARQLINNALSSVCEIIGARPEAVSANPDQRVDLLIATTETEQVILAKCQIPTVISGAECFEFVAEDAGSESAGKKLPDEKNLAAKTNTQAANKAASEAAPARKHMASSDTILRVDADRIDNVLNLVGELIIGKSMLQQAMQEHARRFPKDALRSSFADAMSFQSRVLNDLQRSVMKIRMVPVEQLFRRFPRIIRDAAQRCDKQVELLFSGEETDLDKTLLDAIAEPLTHIVRNCVSHGIETPAERERAGKPAAGKIRLDAYHQANQLMVEVSDDGRGIDSEKIKAKAIKIGVITAEGAAKMSQAEVLDLIFRPGFSTAEEITAVSGRGVGLDVVRSVLQRLKGTVELETSPGKGTKFRLKLPLTLAIIKALMFRIDGKLYAIPLNTVAEIARTRESELHNVETWEVVQLRDQVLPLIRLGAKPALNANKAKIFVLVINFGNRKLGLIVDSLEGEQELVIKSLDDQTVATDLVSGASILGDGRVVLIMNLGAVIERFRSRAAGFNSEPALPPDQDKPSTTPEALQ